jgi:hypothetical protein
MASTADRRYPFDALERRISDVNDDTLAALLGTQRRNLYRWRANGLTEQRAEILAIAAGVLPYEVWPELLDHAIADVERECAAPDCTNRFVCGPKAMKKRYCTRTCNMRIVERERYRRNPEPKGARQRAYDRLVREAKRARDSRRAA